MTIDPVAHLRELSETATRAADQLADGIRQATAITREVALAGGTIFFCGNGGSAADAQHLAAEFSGRYLIERPGLPAVALHANSSAVTAIGNDYGYDHVFSRQLEGMGQPGDVLVAITTSGGSASVRRAVESAHALGMTVIGMTGAKGRAFAALCDVALVTPHALTPHVQEGHIMMGHAFCRVVEEALFGRAAQSAAAKRTSKRTSKRAPARAGRKARS